VRSPSPKKNEKKGSAAEVNEAATSDDGDSKDKGDKSPKMKVPPSSAFGTSAKDTEHHGPGSKDEEDGTSSDAGGIFDPLYQAHGLMSKQFAEFATFIEEEAVPEVVKIKESLLMQVAMMEKLGDAIVENLEAAEAEVAESWSEFSCFIIFKVIEHLLSSILLAAYYYSLTQFFANINLYFHTSHRPFRKLL